MRLWPWFKLVTQQITHISSYFHQTCQLVCLELAYLSEGSWDFSVSKSKRYLPGYKDFQGRNIYNRSWETGPFHLHLLFWRWRQQLPSTRRYLYPNLHGAMTQKTVTFKMFVIISNAYPLLSLYPVSIHTVQYSNYEWICLTHAYCFDLTCSGFQ